MKKTFEYNYARWDKKEPLLDFLNERGVKGWELIIYFEGFFYFKREIE